MIALRSCFIIKVMLLNLWIFFFIGACGGVTFHSLLITRCEITRYSLQKITCYSLQNSLVTCGRSCSLQKFTRYSLQKFTRYSLQNLLVTPHRTCTLQKITRLSLQNSLVTRCKNLLVVKKHSLLVAKFDRDLLHKVTKKSQLNLVMDGKIQMNLNLSIEYFT